MEVGLPLLGDFFLLEPGARREKPGSPKEGQKGTSEYGGVFLDPEEVSRVP